MRAARALPALGLLVLGLLVSPSTSCAQEEAANPLPLERTQTLETGLRVATHRVVDVDGDGADDLLVIGNSGAVRVWRGNDADGAFAGDPVGALDLPHPSRSLLAIADLLADGGPPQLAVLSPRGLAIHTVGPDGAYKRGGQVVLARAKLRLRISAPRFSDILRDVNGDGRPDLVVPRAESCELWLNDGPAAVVATAGTNGAGRLPRFRKVAELAVKVRRHRTTRGGALSDVLEESFHVPSLDFSDVNGDGRDDLLVGSGEERAFHLQQADGAFPQEPDVRVDLSIFRDTTPAAEVRPGEILAGEKDARLETADLDQDGIPDYVVAHRRKVWVFHGSTAGPQFTEPTAILKTAEDVTALLLVPLDEDERPDLLLLRLRVPTIGTVLRGLFAEWDVDLSFAGYANADGRQFERKPRWRSEVALRLPAIMGVLRDLDGFVKRFEGISGTFRTLAEGDLDGDGVDDLAAVSEDETTLDVWRGTPRASDRGAAAELLRLLFKDEKGVWDLDDLLDWFAQAGRRQAAARTGGGPPDRALSLRDTEEFERTGVQCAGRSGPEVIVVAYRRLDDPGHGVFDVFRVP